ncbi:MAG: hypothetical protein HC837_07825 [Chloroflexaceae bacterium]|nr:hypothetical protein [Chloroflexaceae bacterium]
MTLVLSLFWVSSALVPALQAQDADEPDANVEPKVGTPGTWFDFYGTGFDDNERVSFWANGPDGRIDSNDSRYAVVTNEDGRADWRWRAPGDAAPGTWAIVAFGNDSDHEVVLTVQITRPGEAPPSEAPQPPEETPMPAETPGETPPADADANVEPKEGSPGTEFAFFATGFEGGEWVGYWANGPDGRVDSEDNAYAVFANDDGRADWNWRAPEDAAAGAWQVVARGRESGVEHVFFVTIR